MAPGTLCSFQLLINQATLSVRETFKVKLSFSMFPRHFHSEALSLCSLEVYRVLGVLKACRILRGQLVLDINILYSYNLQTS